MEAEEHHALMMYNYELMFKSLESQESNNKLWIVVQMMREEEEKLA